MEEGRTEVPPALSGFPLARIEKHSAVSQVTDRIVTAIAVGAYSPGEQLPTERDLAGLLSVSRVTLRHALAHLVQLGLLESRRGRGGGTFVSERSWKDIAPDAARRTLEHQLPLMESLFDYRCMVEGMIARTAAQRCALDDADRLRAVMTDFDRAPAIVRAREVDKLLHGTITRIARNDHLLTLSAQLTTAATLGFASEPYTQEFYDQARNEHQALVDCIVAGDAEQANELAAAHFRLTATTMRAGLKAAQAKR